MEVPLIGGPKGVGPGVPMFGGAICAGFIDVLGGPLGTCCPGTAPYIAFVVGIGPLYKKNIKK